MNYSNSHFNDYLSGVHFIFTNVQTALIVGSVNTLYLQIKPMTMLSNMVFSSFINFLVSLKAIADYSNADCTVKRGQIHNELNRSL